MFKKKKDAAANQAPRLIGSIYSIACRTANHVIGFKGEIPWKCSEDMKWFERTTKGHSVVMGRRTYESIGHDLLARKNIVLTRDPDKLRERYPESNAIFTDKMYFPESEDETLFVIGGSAIYQLYNGYIQALYLSTIYIRDIEGDCFMAPGGKDYTMDYIGYKDVVVKYTDINGDYKEKKVPYDIIRYNFAPIQS